MNNAEELKVAYEKLNTFDTELRARFASHPDLTMLGQSYPFELLGRNIEALNHAVCLLLMASSHEGIGSESQ